MRTEFLSEWEIAAIKRAVKLYKEKYRPESAVFSHVWDCWENLDQKLNNCSHIRLSFKGDN